jgi:hypothetical protein
MEDCGAWTMDYVTIYLYEIKVNNGSSQMPVGEAEDNVRLRLPTNCTEAFYDNQDATHVIIARQVGQPGTQATKKMGRKY